MIDGQPGDSGPQPPPSSGSGNDPPPGPADLPLSIGPQDTPNGSTSFSSADPGLLSQFQPVTDGAYADVSPLVSHLQDLFAEYNRGTIGEYRIDTQIWSAISDWLTSVQRLGWWVTKIEKAFETADAIQEYMGNKGPYVSNADIAKFFATQPNPCHVNLDYGIGKLPPADQIVNPFANPGDPNATENAEAIWAEDIAKAADKASNAKSGLAIAGDLNLPPAENDALHAFLDDISKKLSFISGSAQTYKNLIQHSTVSKPVAITETAGGGFVAVGVDAASTAAISFVFGGPEDPLGDAVTAIAAPYIANEAMGTYNDFMNLINGKPGVGVPIASELKKDIDSDKSPTAYSPLNFGFDGNLTHTIPPKLPGSHEAITDQIQADANNLVHENPGGGFTYDQPPYQQWYQYLQSSGQGH